MTANGLLAEDENGVPVIKNEMTALSQVAKDKLPNLAEAIQTFVDAVEAETKYQ